MTENSSKWTGGPCRISEPEGLNELLARTRRAAWHVCRGRTDYDDVVQDMMLHIVEQQTADPAYADNTPSYQVKVAMRRAQDLRRNDRGSDVLRRSVLVPLDNDDTDDAPNLHEILPGDPGADAMVLAKCEIEQKRTTHQALRRAIDDDLTDGQRAIIVERFFKGRSTSQVAAHLGISKGTVCSQSYRAFHRLEEAMTDRYPYN